MKKKGAALILALGISAMPISAKQTNRRVDDKDASNISENKFVNKRAANSFKRLKMKELEKDYIRETENEIFNILKY